MRPRLFCNMAGTTARLLTKTPVRSTSRILVPIFQLVFVNGNTVPAGVDARIIDQNVDASKPAQDLFGT